MAVPSVPLSVGSTSNLIGTLRSLELKTSDAGEAGCRIDLEAVRLFITRPLAVLKAVLANAVNTIAAATALASLPIGCVPVLP